MNSKRTLPLWMSASNVNKDEGKKENGNQGAFQADIAYLTFPGSITYCYHKSECNFICEELNKRSSSVKLTFGFDIEWKVSYQTGDYRKTSVIQLCEDEKKCYIFQLSVMNGFPSELKKLLECAFVLKVGVGIHGDADRLKVDYGIDMKGIIDLSKLANEILNNHEKWSLNGLLMNHLQFQLSKQQNVRCSDWEDFPLKTQQLQYAVLDAYAGSLLYRKLTS